MRLRAWFLATSVAAAALFAAAPARAGIDVELTNGDKVFGTLNPITEVETYRFRAPKGAKLTVVAKGKKAGKKSKPPTVAFRLLDGAQQEVGLFVPKGKGGKVVVQALAASDEYVVEVRAGGELPGDYFLKVTWKTPKKFVQKVDTSVSGAPSVEVVADAGAVLEATVKATRKSSAIPVLSRLNGVDVLVDEPFGAKDDPAARSHKDRLTLGATGVFNVSTTDTSAGGGPVTLVVKVKKPKNRRKIRLTSKELGALGIEGNDAAFGGLVGASGGSVFFTGEGAIQGAGITVPGGALGGPTPLVVGTSPDLDPGSQQGAGPTVSFGPDGQEFSAAVELTLPFNTAPFDPNFTGIGVIVSDGSSVSVDPNDIDAGSGTLSIPTTHFSSYRVVAPPIPAATRGDVTGDAVADLLLAGAATGGVQEASVYLFSGGAGFATGPALTTTDAAARLFDDVNPGSRFGLRVATGDVNGDGTEDAMVTDDQDGKVYTFFGGAPTDRGTSTADLLISVGAQSGRSIAVGDLDDDGVQDALIGVPTGAGPLSTGSPGVALTVQGRVNHTVTSIGPTSPGVRTFAGETDEDEFGFRVRVGDVTGDGKLDLIISAPRLNRGLTGVVYVFPGGSNLVDRDVSQQTPPIVITGQLPNDQFGDALAVADVNGDDIDDLIVGAPGHSNALSLPNPFRQGAVFVFYGGDRLVLHESGTTADRRFEGTAAEDLLGTSVAAADLNGDGIAEVIAGAPGADPNSLVNSGEVYVFAGADRDGMVESDLASVANLRIAGEAAGDHFGTLERPIDLNGDGSLDLIAIAPFFGTDQGRAYVFLGGLPTLPAGVSAADAEQTITGRDNEKLGDPFAVQAP